MSYSINTAQNFITDKMAVNLTLCCNQTFIYGTVIHEPPYVIESLGCIYYHCYDGDDVS